MGTWNRCLASLAILGAAATLHAAPPPAFSVAAVTPHFKVYTRGEKVNAGRIEGQVTRIEQLLGRQLEGHASFYVYERPEEISAVTGYYADGVTFSPRREIHSVPSAAGHEIVHLVAGQVGDPGAFFHEGLAVALTAGGRWAGESLAKIARKATRELRPLASIVSGFERLDPQVGYPLAGAFVSHLIEDHGLPTVMKFFAACKGRFDERAFRQAFGSDLNESGQAWMASL
jgi:hypothetical protein